MTDNGLLAFDLASGTTTLAQNISGTGSLKHPASNVLCLTGSNTYSGSTTITSGGTLQIGSGGATARSATPVAIADGGLLAFDLSSGTTTFALHQRQRRPDADGTQPAGAHRQQYLHR